MNIEFNSLVELYERLKPAITTKQREFKRLGYDYIKTEDIWNFLKEKKWLKANDLGLHQMVSDIFDLTEYEIDSYVKEKLSSRDRNIYFDDKDELL
ncbi:MAG: post-transcriptional regulator [Bacilli bacterium]